MRPSLPKPCLCLVTDRRLTGEDQLVNRVARAVAGGVNLVQLREKDLPGGRLLALAESLKSAIGDSARLVINERVDVAACVSADGVQLGEEALSVSEARAVLGPGLLVGRSVHSLEGAVQAVGQGADFLVVGTMFVSPSHPGEEPAGPDLIGRIAIECSVPLIGIGGINLFNLGQVMDAGASGVAVISSILAAADPQEAAYRMNQAMLSALPATRARSGSG
ncbi:MAG TPA: thiamine phosphate synthase [Dehalococcoidia bacterium]|jgi:thiamine-phosphate pyrophosphorylase|nr:thiamine phosphate synthase [Dehalococcoidia bacterium]